VQPQDLPCGVRGLLLGQEPHAGFYDGRDAARTPATTVARTR
jgi:hypothetical protein